MLPNFRTPLTKRGLLEFLGTQREPITTKVASIDIDSRASTVTEMLERCVAQGLAERATNQRPREYGLSDEGSADVWIHSDPKNANITPNRLPNRTRQSQREPKKSPIQQRRARR